MTGKRRAEESPREGQSVPAVPIARPAGAKPSRTSRESSRPRHLNVEGSRQRDAAARKPRKAAAKPASAPPSSERTAEHRPTARGRAGRIYGPSSARSSSSRERREERTRAAGEAARDYASRSAIARAGGGKPSTTGRAIGGAAGGAAAGAAIGGPVGAVAGGALGGVGGAIGGARAKRAYKALTRRNPTHRRALVAEFLICVTITALSSLTDKHRSEPAAAWMKRMAGVMVVFLVLSMISSFGRGASRLAVGFGGLITVVLATSERDLFVKLAEVFGGGTAGASAAGAAGGSLIETPDKGGPATGFA